MQTGLVVVEETAPVRLDECAERRGFGASVVEYEVVAIGSGCSGAVLEFLVSAGRE